MAAQAIMQSCLGAAGAWFGSDLSSQCPAAGLASAWCEAAAAGLAETPPTIPSGARSTARIVRKRIGRNTGMERR